MKNILLFPVCLFSLFAGSVTGLGLPEDYRVEQEQQKLSNFNVFIEEAKTADNLTDVVDKIGKATGSVGLDFAYLYDENVPPYVLDGVNGALRAAFDKGLFDAQRRLVDNSTDHEEKQLANETLRRFSLIYFNCIIRLEDEAEEPCEDENPAF